MRSVVVVLPASMWAMMPMFLQRSNGTVLGTAYLYSFWAPKSAVSYQPSAKTLVILSGVLCREGPTHFLPPVMRECLIGFRHAVNVFFFLDGCAFTVGGIQQ